MKLYMTIKRSPDVTLCQNPDKKKNSKLEIAMIRNSNYCHNTLSSCFIKCENSNLRAGVHQVPLLGASSFSRRTGSV